MREAGAAILFDPRKREIDAGRNTGGSVDVAVFDPEWIVLDADTWISGCHLAAESPMCGCSAIIQQPSIGKQKSANAYSAQPAHFGRHPLQPGREFCISYGPTA